ncbi:ABC transporter permease subunit [Blastococcus brunescens]|uniref:ABC transporter permease subunit n=1 Tax=Blastococcus brunescens TaxID=1564165 RepID=A0ABZ1B4X9_9ACTN|nr:ABC transporter permease subunit [Blastococcus sp. BMG 8361]WRL65432.1 ABC transporter permease subunit [Blastococcus sp. BMG 8361]
MIAFAVRASALGYAAIQPSLTAISREMDWAAYTAGASWGRTSTNIIMPLLKPAIASCFVIMFVSIFNDYDPAVFLVTSGTEVIGLTMLQQWTAGFAGPVAALGVIQMVITATVIAIGYFLFGARTHA